MGSINIEGVSLIKLRQIEGDKGNVLHAIKKSSEGFAQFGEAYFSTVYTQEVKGWKKHREMILNLVVPVGKIKFVLMDDRPDSETRNNFFEIELSLENYCRLVIPPGIWVAFKGMGQATNLLLNVASIEHDPTEADNLDLYNPLFCDYEW